ncbi:pyrimidine dimer DNA glycosylase/endonuclease V [Candidatus Nitrosotenuis aquarius]|uniref:pyrimidine dimer DNA glycosylase/endonuclease V n=1 Tax=Candidatus Nitrosotenuis aquarius TaxID=1846278 RepID=UPI000C1EFC87|nr:pyrimidine dimer DNA glycosylase/endonuclease V [Candidatus Nitrosotenuis aquarius]
MRVWDIQPKKLCREHLLGEHRELHAIWTILTQGKTGYSHHPETLRWRGKLHALYHRHDLLVSEMIRRGYNHNSNLDKRLASGTRTQNDFVDSYQDQIKILRQKNCACEV